MMRRILRPLAVFCSSLSLGGCYYFPDFGVTNPAYHVPVAAVVNQIKCEVRDFLDNYDKIDRNIFWLDPNSYVAIILTLNVNEVGDVNFSRLRAEGLDPSRDFIATGGGPFGNPFPSFRTRATKQSTAVVTINIPQDRTKLGKCDSHLDALNPPKRHPAFVNNLRVSEWLTHLFERASDIKVQKPRSDCPAPPARIVVPPATVVKDPPPYAKETPKQRAAAAAIAAEQAEAAIPGANCEVALDSIQLNSRFALLVDFQAGVIPLAKLFPVIPVPSVDLSVEYTHTIQLLFNGYNYVKTAAANKQVSKNRALGPEDPQASDAASIVRELRSLRDATLLSIPR